jgi:opacity protein-like surface antigen
MKKKLAIVAGCSLFLAAGAAQAAPNTPYFGAGLGLVKMNDSTLSDASGSVDVGFDNGLGLIASAGYSFDAARVELEFGYRKNDLDSFSALGVSVPGSGELTSKSLMANFYYDFTPKEQWSPFVGAGVGMARVDVDNAAVAGITIGEADDTVFAWQLMAGIACRVSDNAVLDFSYRYFATADPDFAGTEAEYGSHNLFAGVRFSF